MSLFDNFVAVILTTMTSFTSSIQGAPVPPVTQSEMTNVQVSINEAVEQSQNEQMVSGVAIIDRAYNNRMKTGGFSHEPLSMQSLGRLPILLYAVRVDDDVAKGEVPEIVEMVQGFSGDATDAMWDKYGGNTILNDLTQRYNLQETKTGQSWSDAKMSAVDVGRLLRRFLDDNAISPKKKAWTMSLMRNTAMNASGNDFSFGLPSALNAQESEQRLSWMQGWSGTGAANMVRSSVGVYGNDMRYIVVVLGEVPPTTTDEDANNKINLVTQKLVAGEPFYEEDEEEEKPKEFAEKQAKKFPNSVGSLQK